MPTKSEGGTPKNVQHRAKKNDASKQTTLETKPKYRLMAEKREQFLETVADQMDYVDLIAMDMKQTSDENTRYLNCGKCLQFAPKRRVGVGKIHNTDKWLTVAQIIGKGPKNSTDRYGFFVKNFLEPKLQVMVELGLAKEVVDHTGSTKIAFKPFLVAKTCSVGDTEYNEEELEEIAAKVQEPEPRQTAGSGQQERDGDGLELTEVLSEKTKDDSGLSKRDLTSFLSDVDCKLKVNHEAMEKHINAMESKLKASLGELQDLVRESLVKPADRMVFTRDVSQDYKVKQLERALLEEKQKSWGLELDVSVLKMEKSELQKEIYRLNKVMHDKDLEIKRAQETTKKPESSCPSQKPVIKGGAKQIAKVIKEQENRRRKHQVMNEWRDEINWKWVAK